MAGCCIITPQKCVCLLFMITKNFIYGEGGCPNLTQAFIATWAEYIEQKMFSQPICQLRKYNPPPSSFGRGSGAFSATQKLSLCGFLVTMQYAYKQVQQN